MKPRELVALPWLLALRAWRRVAGTGSAGFGFRILVLHDVPTPDLVRLDTVLARIESHHGFITPDQAARHLGGDMTLAEHDQGRVPYLLSFDDGFVSNLAVARHVLSRHDAKAIFFVCPGIMDLPPEAQPGAIATRIFNHGPGAAEPVIPERLMNWSEVAELRDMGHAIGAHGLNHRRLAGLPAAELAQEVREPGARLLAELDTRPEWFAYPFGDISSIDEAALAEIGRHYRYCRSGVRGINCPDTNPLAIFAEPLDLAAGGPWRELVLDGGLDPRYRAARTRLNGMTALAGHSAPP